VQVGTAFTGVFEKLRPSKLALAKLAPAKLAPATVTLLVALSLAACAGEDKGGAVTSAATTAVITPASTLASTPASTTALTTPEAKDAGSSQPVPADLHTADLHTADPHTTGPRTTDPHTTGPHTTGPHTADLHSADPHAAHAAHEVPLAATELPGTSLFHLSGAFTGQDGAEFRLGDLRGQPSVIVMFYGDCTTACPLLVKSAQDIEAALPTEVAEQTQFVMVSFDTARDTPAKLRAYAQERGLDKGRWHWLVGSELLTRQLATLLGVQYRDAGNGTFAHSNLVTVLDEQGVPEARVEGLGAALDPAVDAIRAALN